MQSLPQICSLYIIPTHLLSSQIVAPADALALSLNPRQAYAEVN
jgi:hypothetical protein